MKNNFKFQFLIIHLNNNQVIKKLNQIRKEIKNLIIYLCSNQPIHKIINY